jgi:hypothetical protein
MPVTISFRGLCALVSDSEEIQGSSTLDVVLVDAAAAGAHHPHIPRMRFREADLISDPGHLAEPDPVSGWLRLPLMSRRLKVLAQGSSATGISAQSVDSLASLRRACGVGTIHEDCLADKPKLKPVASRIELPNGTIVCDVDLAPNEWSFYPTPPGLKCYSGRFSKEVQHQFDATQVEIQVKNFGETPHTLTFSGSSQIQVRNESVPPLGRVRFVALDRVEASRRSELDDLPLAEDPPHGFALYKLLKIDPEHKPYIQPFPMCDLGQIRVFDDGDVGCIPVRTTKI